MNHIEDIKLCNDPAHAARVIIEEVMLVGSAKDGNDSSWRDKSHEYHITKGLRHATTALMIHMRVIAPDGEDHLALAITRLAMALCNKSDPLY